MTKPVWAFPFMLSALGLVLTASAQAPGDDKKGAWKSYTSKEGRFTIEVPPGYTCKEEKNSLTLRRIKGNDSYHVLWKDIKQKDLEKTTPDRVFDQDREKVKEVLGGSFKPPLGKASWYEKKIKLGDYPGREVMHETERTDIFGRTMAGTRGRGRWRLFLVKGRLYTVVVSGPLLKGDTSFAVSKEADRFLASFKLLK
jgi:hypothetical protein